MAGLELWLDERIDEVEKKHAESSDSEPLSIAIGIDLGTTNSSASFFNTNPGVKRPDVIYLEMGAIRERLPSVVWFDQRNDRILVGDPAYRMAALRPLEVKAEFKRDMPKASSVTYTLGEKEGARTETPTSLSAMILKEIRIRAEKALTERHSRPVSVTTAVITVPANFPEEAPAATMDAAKAAGFTDVHLIDEPTAAALAYALLEGTPPGKKILVFDFGGGTLDASILSTPGDDGRPFKVTNSCGDAELGGKDFDTALVGHLAASVAAASRRPAEDGPFDVLSDEDIGINMNKRYRWRAALKDEAERVKVALTETESADFSFASDDLVDFDGAPLTVSGTVTRKEFEDLVKPLIERATRILQRTLDEAKLEKADIDRLVLVGGTTKVPVVVQAVRDFLGQGPYRNVDPLTAVAQGAAVYGFLLTSVAPKEDAKDGETPKDGEKREVVSSPLELRTSHNFGVRWGLDKLDTLIPKNEPLPSSSAPQSYGPARADSDEVVVPLYQYDDSLVSRAGKDGGPITLTGPDFDERRAYEIGQVHVTGLTGSNRAIDVTFTMDENRILSVVVRRQSDGREFASKIERTR